MNFSHTPEYPQLVSSTRMIADIIVSCVRSYSRSQEEKLLRELELICRKRKASVTERLKKV